MVMGKMTSVYSKLMGNAAALRGCIILERKTQCLEEKAAPVILFMVTLLEDVFSSVRGVLFKLSNLSFLSHEFIADGPSGFIVQLEEISLECVLNLEG